MVLIYFARRRQQVPFRSLFWLFGAFILSCGTTHLVDVWTFYYPAYRFLGLLKLVTAVVSWVTVIALIPVTPRALAMRFPEELEAEIRERRRAEANLKELNEALEQKVSERTRLAEQRAAELASSEQLLLEKTRILESVLTNIGEGVVVTDSDGNFIHVNAAALELLPELASAPSEHELWPRHFGLVDEQGVAIPADELPSVRAARGEEVRGQEIRFLREDSELWLRVTARPLPLDGGGSVAVFHDITQNRQTLNELSRARDEAIRANAVKSQFLASVSHELRTPLNGIQGMLEFLQETELSERQHDFAGVALSCSRTLLHLIDDILDLSKIEAGKLKLHPAPFPAQRLLRSLADMFRLSEQESDLRLVCELDPQTPEWVEGDESRVLQILTNLVGNAFKYAGRGEILVAVQPAEPGHLRLLVEDQGPGIPEHFQARLFEPFSQVEDSSRHSRSGVGLGLAIVRRLVELMQGTLNLTSNSQGTRYQIELPLAECPPPEVVAQTAEVELSNLKVMVVEDNPINRRVLGLQLKKLGVAGATMAEDGQQALAAIEQLRPDLILLDCQLPGMDGFEVARTVRQSPQKYGAPTIIALTAHALAHERERCFEVGMNDFLSKPLAFDDLKEALHRWSK